MEFVVHMNPRNVSEIASFCQFAKREILVEERSKNAIERKTILRIPPTDHNNASEKSIEGNKF